MVSDVALFDLSPQEALALVAPDMAWLSMLPITPLRRGRSPKCYTTPRGTEVHVQPDCRCQR